MSRCVRLELARLRDIAPTWVLLAATACVAPQVPASVVEPAVPYSPLHIVRLIEPEVPPAPAPLQEIEAPFEPAPESWRPTEKVFGHRGRGCSLIAETDPEILVVYSMIDVYALIAPGLEFRDPLPELAEQPPCIDGYCRRNKPNAVLIDDGGTAPIDGRAYGFVIPIASGFWVLPLGEQYREQDCVPEIEAETIADGHARLTIIHVESDVMDCDDGSSCDECWYEGATRYDLFYDSNIEQALLVTHRYDELDDWDEPTPAIEVGLVEDGVRVAGCKADDTIPWPRSRY